MKAAALLLFLASSSQVLLDEPFQVPAGEWRYVPLVLRQMPVVVDYEFRVVSGKSTVRVTVLNQEGLDRLKKGDREALESDSFRMEGRFSRPLTLPDDYAVVLENGRGGPVTVKLRISVDFSGRGSPQARYLSPQRQFAVIVISATVFLGILIYSARKLRGAMR